jgi:hypothetical protein
MGLTFGAIMVMTSPRQSLPQKTSLEGGVGASLLLSSPFMGLGSNNFPQTATKPEIREREKITCLASIIFSC